MGTASVCSAPRAGAAALWICGSSIAPACALAPSEDGAEVVAQTQELDQLTYERKFSTDNKDWLYDNGWTTADCREREVLTGFGARFGINGLVNAINAVAICRDIDPNTHELSQEEKVYDQMNAGAEMTVRADDGFIVVGLGGGARSYDWVGSLRIKECYWDPQRNEVDPSQCFTKTVGDVPIQRFLDAHDGRDLDRIRHTVVGGAVLRYFWTGRPPSIDFDHDVFVDSVTLRVGTFVNGDPT